jgi:hypothetical protein
MRRKDREITDIVKIKEMINNCHCCRLGFNDNGKVYIVPLNFGYEEVCGKITFYFHGATEGRKIDLIKKEGYAGFELDTDYKLKTASEACGYSASFSSVIGTGSVSLIDDIEDKKYALRQIMYHNTGNNEWDFPMPMLNKVSVFKLEVEELSCKQHD